MRLFAYTLACWLGVAAILLAVGLLFPDILLASQASPWKGCAVCILGLFLGLVVVVLVIQGITSADRSFRLLQCCRSAKRVRQLTADLYGPWPERRKLSLRTLADLSGASIDYFDRLPFQWRDEAHFETVLALFEDWWSIPPAQRTGTFEMHVTDRLRTVARALAPSPAMEEGDDEEDEAPDCVDSAENQTGEWAGPALMNAVVRFENRVQQAVDRVADEVRDAVLDWHVEPGCASETSAALPPIDPGQFADAMRGKAEAAMRDVAQIINGATPDAKAGEEQIVGRFMQLHQQAMQAALEMRIDAAVAPLPGKQNAWANKYRRWKAAEGQDRNA